MRLDLTGHVYGDLTVLHRVGVEPSISGYQKWQCSCSCGEQHVTTTVRLRKGKAISCAKCGLKRSHKQGTGNNNWQGIGIIGKRWYTQRMQAVIKDIKRKGWEHKVWELTFEQVYEVAEKQGFKCAFTGQQLDFSRHSSPNSASIDRKNNGLGYTIDNIQIVTAEINFMRGSLDVEYFKKLCKLVVDASR